MKKVFLFIFSFLFFHQAFNAQEQFYTVLRNGGNGVNVAELDSSYILIGREYDSSPFNHIYLHKLNLEGDTVEAWSFEVDTALTTEINFVNSVNGNFISGFFWGEEGLDTFGYLMNLSDDYSSLISTTSYEIADNGTTFKVINKKNDSTLIIGALGRDNQLDDYSILIEMDTSGSINWTRSFYCGVNCILWPYQIESALDGGCFFTCQEFHNYGGSGSMAYDKTVIIKTDDLGFEEYRYHPGDEDYHIRAGWVIQSNDSNYIAAYSDPAFAEFDQPSNLDNTIWVVKFDIDGNELWEVSLFDDLPISEWGNGYNYTIRKMIKVDNGFLIGGSDGGLYGFLFKLDFEGNLIWKRYYTHPQWEENSASSQRTAINGFTQTSDSGFILTGYYFSTSGNIYPTGIAAAIVIKVDEFGCLEPGCELADNIEEESYSNFDFQVFPNPVTDRLRVSFKKASEELFSIKIFSLSGKELLHEEALYDQSTIDISQLTSGMYILQVELENGYKKARKFVKE